MRITESQLRRIIADEARRFKKSKSVNESFPGANEELFNAMENFIQGWMEESGTEDSQGACQALRNEVEGFCKGFLDEYPTYHNYDMGEPDDRWEKKNLRSDEYGPAIKRR